MTLQEIAKRILDGYNDYDPYDVTEDVDKEGLTIDLMDLGPSDLLGDWGIESEESYNSELEELEKFQEQHNTNELFGCYFSYDVSGYDYWMKQQQEMQYLHLSIQVDSELTEEQFSELLTLIDKFAAVGYSFIERNQFDPSKN